MSTKHFDSYLQTIDSPELRSAVTKTRDHFRESVLEDFDYITDSQVLFYGDVQSGKTSHMLGVIADALDSLFQTVIVLTSPNVRLINQTHSRILHALPEALVCNRDQVNEYLRNANRDVPKKSVVVLGKIRSGLDKWLKAFKKTDGLTGNPILIVDDEADATSLNTLVNQGKTSAINERLTRIRDLSTGCVYMQVTGTPQAVILQSGESGWDIEKSVHFKPGENYVGGKLFFDELPNPYTRVFPGDEESEDHYLRDAVLTHLVTCACFKSNGWRTCNMLLHPSHLTEVHFDYKADVISIVDDFFRNDDIDAQTKLIQPYHAQIAQTYPDVLTPREIVEELREMKEQFRFLAVNSSEHSTEDDWKAGYNFIVGGNSLGRGLTFNFLQTVFYIRDSSRPQADTLWQHARMFGYARHIPTLRLFLPAHLAKMFQEVHEGNELIKQQLDAGISPADLRVVLKGNVAPTRKNVLDRRLVGRLSGGVNYFAENPINIDFARLDAKLTTLQEKHGDDFKISTLATSNLTKEFEVEQEDLDLATFRVALAYYAEHQPHITARVILRRGRKVNRGTGTLLSPTDQKLARGEGRHPLLILYRIEDVNSSVPDGGLKWSSDPIWVPNIRLPDERQYWRVDG